MDSECTSNIWLPDIYCCPVLSPRKRSVAYPHRCRGISSPYSPDYIGRVAEHATEIARCPINAGDWTVLAFPSANRDPGVLDRPDQVLIHRTENRDSTFSLGVHRFLGSNFTCLKMQIAMEMRFERFLNFELTDPAPITSSVVMSKADALFRSVS